ncbi:hypothetical protein EYF80_034504 [Liparis tanakae]|uniref:Uncharacterized protein n=1 Tax=Liparis tanakae TaxID=230148 RepID=A0A4Z2GNL2_9TELE|nr:hypothetical protein EYF80_034504 [Liparis tanakae]
MHRFGDFIASSRDEEQLQRSGSIRKNEIMLRTKVQGIKLSAWYTYLSEALEVEDEYVGESPQAHLHHALLELLTVRTLPGVVRGELESLNALVQRAAVLLQMLLLLAPHALRPGNLSPTTHGPQRTAKCISALGFDMLLFYVGAGKEERALWRASQSTCLFLQQLNPLCSDEEPFRAHS